MPSIRYYLFRTILKLKGIKSIFSTDPIPYQKLRKDDVYNAPKFLSQKNKLQTFEIANSKVTVLNRKVAVNNDYLLIYCPGGAFVSGPSMLAWLNLDKIIAAASCTAWMVNYPKAPEFSIDSINQSMDALYQKASLQYKAQNIILMGDSAGGNLIISLVQRLLTAKADIPRQIIAISPLVDCSLSQAACHTINAKDPMLSVQGVLSANTLCAASIPLNDPQISPLFGSFKGFPSVQLFVAENDILSPGIELMILKMQAQNTTLDIIRGESMPHVWPVLFFFKEAKLGLKAIIDKVCTITKQ